MTETITRPAPLDRTPVYMRGTQGDELIFETTLEKANVAMHVLSMTKPNARACALFHAYAHSEAASPAGRGLQHDYMWWLNEIAKDLHLVALELVALRAQGKPALITRPDGYYEGTLCPQGMKGTLPGTAWFLDAYEAKPFWWAGPLPLLRSLVARGGLDWHPCQVDGAFLVTCIDWLAMTACKVLTTHIEVTPGDRTPDEWLAQSIAAWGLSICVDVAHHSVNPDELKTEMARAGSPLNVFQDTLRMLS